MYQKGGKGGVKVDVDNMEVRGEKEEDGLEQEKRRDQERERRGVAGCGIREGTIGVSEEGGKGGVEGWIA